jgi:hypothetical protein
MHRFAWIDLGVPQSGQGFLGCLLLIDDFPGLAVPVEVFYVLR